MQTPCACGAFIIARNKGVTIPNRIWGYSVGKLPRNILLFPGGLGNLTEGSSAGEVQMGITEESMRTFANYDIKIKQNKNNIFQQVLQPFNNNLPQE